MPINVKRPSESGGGSTVPDGFDETVSYRTQLTLIEERASTQPNSKSKTYLSWHLTPYDSDGVAWLDPTTGAPLDVFASSPIEMWANATTGEIAKGREYVNAFMGHDVDDDEMDGIIDEGFDTPLIGRWALGSYEVQMNGNWERVKLLKLRPIGGRSRQPAAPAAAPAPMPQQRAIPPRQRVSVPPADDDKQPPF